MERILRRIGQTDGYGLIVERSEAGVIYVPTNLDVTDLVIQRYNSGEGQEGAAKPAAPAAGPKSDPPGGVAGVVGSRMPR